jgi:hypothetical protein
MSIVNDLDALGKTSEQVADFLKARGVKGTIGNVYSCPIANYLNSLNHKVAGVSWGSIRFQYGGCIDTPPAVCQFIVDFDQGKYPELIKE